MIKVIKYSNIHGEAEAPPSKSFMVRAVAMAVLSKQETTILNPTYCNDALDAISIARALGYNAESKTNKLIISKNSKLQMHNEILCGESALSMRLFAPIVALTKTPVSLTAKGSLQKRPAQFMADTFKQLGVKFSTNNGFPPLHILGSISKYFAKIDGSISSQFLSGLLMALPKANADSTLIVNNLVSIPYVDMTLEIIKLFGGEIHNTADYSEFKIKANQHYACSKYTIEGDWSGAAPLLVSGAIAGGVSVRGLNVKSAQADKKILQAIEQTGANISYDNNSINISKSDTLKAFNFNALHCPDLFPTLTALAANCEGTSCISGVGRLAYKESNRALALQQEFAKMGINITFDKDDMLVVGGKIKTAHTNTHNDHRIAMAISVAALKTNTQVSINNAECVNKTYPKFFDDMVKLGAKITSKNSI